MMTLACGCGGGFELLVLIVLYLIVPFIIALVVTVLLIKWGVRAMAAAIQHGSFAGKLASVFSAGLIVPAAINSALTYVALCNSGNRHPDPFWIAMLILVVPLGVAGTSFLRLHEKSLAQPANRPSAIWLQDLLIATASIGAWLTFARALPHSQDQFPLAAVYILATSAGGLALAIDLFRSSSAGQQPRSRALGFATVFLLAPILGPAFALTWAMWGAARKRAAKAQAKLERLSGPKLETFVTQQA